MVTADAILTSLYLKLFHETLVAHLLHNSPMKVKPHLKDIDQLVAKVISATVQTKLDKPNSLSLVARLSFL